MDPRDYRQYREPSRGRYYSTDDTYDQSEHYVKLRGLPFEASIQDVLDFVRLPSMTAEDVRFHNNARGRFNGVAVVRVQSADEYQSIMDLHGQNVGSRYIETFRAEVGDFMPRSESRRSESRHPQRWERREHEPYVVKLRGIPFESNEGEILDFLLPIQPEDGQVYMPKSRTGRSTGLAFVKLRSKADFEDCMAKHRQLIGRRYIEVFESSVGEMDSVDSPRQRAPRFEPQRRPNLSFDLTPETPAIRLRGLPFDVREQDIIDFFQDCQVKQGGIFFHHNQRGRFSGSAYLAMNSTWDADRALDYNGRYIGSRYVEIFKCTAEDLAQNIGLEMSRGHGSSEGYRDSSFQEPEPTTKYGYQPRQERNESDMYYD